MATQLIVQATDLCRKLQIAKGGSVSTRSKPVLAVQVQIFFKTKEETAIYVGFALDEVLIGVKILYKVFYNHTLNVSKPSKTRLFNRKNKLHYSKTKPIFHLNTVYTWQLCVWSVSQISRNTARHHKQRVTRSLYSVLLRWGHRGGGGVTQYRNTVRRNGKYRNTVSKMNEIPIPHL